MKIDFPCLICKKTVHVEKDEFKDYEVGFEPVFCTACGILFDRIEPESLQANILERLFRGRDRDQL